MVDYYEEKRRQRILCAEIDFILDSKEIPGKLLERLGVKDEIDTNNNK